MTATWHNKAAAAVIGVLLASAAHAQKTISVGGDENYSSQSMTVGDTLVVKLRPAVGYQWMAAPGGDNAVLAPDTSHARPTPGMTTLRFTAVNSGIVTLVINNVKRSDTAQAHPVQIYQLLVGVNSRPGEAKPGVVVGHFSGKMPCADCTGITVDLTLYAKGANELVDTIFDRKLTYEGKPEGQNTFEDKGNWVLLAGTADDANANVYQLTNSKGEVENYWLKTTDELVPLDTNKKPLEGPAGASLMKVQ